jgi:hypothetical protein
MALSIFGIFATLNIDIHQNSIACHYAECHDFFIVMLSVGMLSVVMLIVVAPLPALATQELYILSLLSD